MGWGHFSDRLRNTQSSFNVSVEEKRSRLPSRFRLGGETRPFMRIPMSCAVPPSIAIHKSSLASPTPPDGFTLRLITRRLLSSVQLKL